MARGMRRIKLPPALRDLRVKLLKPGVVTQRFAHNSCASSLHVAIVLTTFSPP
jgi:hypothetical protein